MSKLPDGITEEDLKKYIKIKKQLDRVQPLYVALGDKIRSAYIEAYPKLSDKKTIIVDDVGAVVTLTPRTGLNSARFQEDHPYSEDENKKYYKVSPDTSAIQKEEALKTEYYEEASTAFSFAITE